MKLKNLSIAILALGFFLVISCKDEGKTEATPAGTEMNTNTTEGATESTTEGATAALNPKHGQTGHRCDIPVGTLLDQPKKTNTQQTQSVSPPISPVWAKETTPAKNPTHGQPGHRCDIPVGADLNS